MTSIGDLMKLPARRSGTAWEVETLLGAFLEIYDGDVHRLLRHLDGTDKGGQTFLERLSADVLIEGAATEDETHVLTRLSFDTRPFALVRWLRPADEEEDDEAVVRLTDGLIAERLVDALRQITQTPKMEETAVKEDAADLIDFGYNAVLDMAAQTVRYQTTERLVALANRNGVGAVLLRLEDGRLALSEHNRGRTIHTDAEACRRDFLDLVQRETAAHRQRFDQRRGRAEVGSVFLHCAGDEHLAVVMSDDRGLVLSRLRGRGPGKEAETLARGVACYPELLKAAEAVVDRLLGLTAEPTAPQPRCG